MSSTTLRSRRAAANTSARSPRLLATAVALCAALSAAGCREHEAPSPVLTISGSAVGAEGELLARQLARFAERHSDVRVLQRQTPDAADQRHQLYVQWLNAGVGEPDILQLDVIWTAEFAAAGWLLPLERFGPPTEDYFPAALSANRWGGRLYALPWFVDVGMLYWRTDLLDRPPESLEELATLAAQARTRAALPYGLVWQAARYEGLVCVFLEVLTACGGSILDEQGRVTVGSDAAVRALTFMRDAFHDRRIVPEAALAWREEQTRFAFQNGLAVFMRNWPYASALLQRATESRVAGNVAVAPIPGARGGRPAAALGGGQLAVNARSRNPEAAYKLIAFLLEPEQMLERARVVGQYPSRRSLYDRPELAEHLGVAPTRVREIIEGAVPRPVTPVYAELSELLQIHLHRALTGQEEPAVALSAAAREMRALLRRTGLDAGTNGGPIP